jgi:hypothetical protein
MRVQFTAKLKGVECSAKTVVDFFSVYSFLLPEFQIFCLKKPNSLRSFAKGAQGKDIAHGQAERHCTPIPKKFTMCHDS